jgi:hypothetical protein
MRFARILSSFLQTFKNNNWTSEVFQKTFGTVGKNVIDADGFNILQSA